MLGGWGRLRMCSIGLLADCFCCLAPLLILSKDLLLFRTLLPDQIPHLQSHSKTVGLICVHFRESECVMERWSAESTLRESFRKGAYKPYTLNP